MVLFYKFDAVINFFKEGGGQLQLKMVYTNMCSLHDHALLYQALDLIT